MQLSASLLIHAAARAVGGSPARSAARAAVSVAKQLRTHAIGAATTLYKPIHLATGSDEEMKGEAWANTSAT